jgi:hypothetical protein
MPVAPSICNSFLSSKNTHTYTTKTGRGKRQNKKRLPSPKKAIGRNLAAACKTPIKTLHKNFVSFCLADF